MQSLYLLPLLDLNHIFAYQKQNGATSATEVNVSRCLLWKYVMSNKTWVIIQELRIAHALLVYSKFNKWNIMLAISVPGPILRKWPFLSANGVLATLLVIFHLSCEMSPSFTLFAPIPRNAMQSLESGFLRCYTFFMIIFNNSNIQNVFPECIDRKVLSFSRRLDSNLVDRFLSSSNIDEWCWKSVKETLEYILRRLKINVNAISCSGYPSSSF